VPLETRILFDLQGDEQVALVGTVGSVFPSVYVVDVPDTFNSIVYATKRPTRAENLVANRLGLEGSNAPPLLLDVLGRAIDNLRPTPESEVVFTDDRAPVEQLTNSMAIRFILRGNLDTLR
jgi:hypothetical protein